MIVDFEWYRSFSAIYRLGTVTAAARERGLTQPAVTQHLAALEAVTGEPLFARTPRRMLPTERGKLLYTSLAPALEALEQATFRLKRPAQQLPTLRLGSAREFFGARVLPLLADAPFRLRVRFGLARELLAALAGGELDLVVASERLLIAGIDYRRLAEERFVLVGAAGLEPPDDEEVLP
ncbi:MAG TPA: LysR family transcriptional regulator, partial [Herpetosiphonaceae bacterium]